MQGTRGKKDSPKQQPKPKTTTLTNPRTLLPPTPPNNNQNLRGLNSPLPLGGRGAGGEGEGRSGARRSQPKTYPPNNYNHHHSNHSKSCPSWFKNPNLPSNCRFNGKFVLNSPSIQNSKSYENHHPTTPKRRYPPHTPRHSPNNTKNHPHSETAALETGQRQKRQLPAKKRQKQQLPHPLGRPINRNNPQAIQQQSC